MAYKVPFIDYPTHYRRLKDEIDTAIEEVLSKGDLILCSQVRRFEDNISSFVGVSYGTGVNSCTDALHLSLRAAGLGKGDEVITVAHTFISTVAVIVHCGATPVLVDVGEDFDMDVEQIEKAISPRTKAVIPVHLNGRVCDMERLMSIASKHNLIVIEDAAQALGASFDGKRAGSFGLAGCFSFYPAKILGAFGDAGIAVTDNKEFAEKMRLLRDHGRQPGDNIAFFGFNSRLDNLQAAILDVKLNYVPGWIERRRELAGLYQKGLTDISELRLPPSPNSHGRYYDAFQNYVVRTQERDRLVQHLRESGIETMVSLANPVHSQKTRGLGHFRLPVTEQLSKEVLSLPMYAELSNEHVEYVIESVRRFYANQ